MAGEGQLWEIIGGADKGGIIVRTGEKLDSPTAEPDRLSTGAVVQQKALVRDRLHYDLLISGTGPAVGWVSTKLKDKVLAVKKKRDASEDASEFLPNGRGKLLLLSVPMQGHIIHMRRIAEWFAEHAPAYEVHAAMLPDADMLKMGVPANLPPSVKCHEPDESEAQLADLLPLIVAVFRGLAASPNEDVESSNREGSFGIMKAIASLMSKVDVIALFLRYAIRVIETLQPDLVIADGMWNANGIVPCFCHSKGVPYVVMQSPGIPEHGVNLDMMSDCGEEVFGQLLQLPTAAVSKILEAQQARADEDFDKAGKIMSSPDFLTLLPPPAKMNFALLGLMSQSEMGERSLKRFKAKKLGISLDTYDKMVASKPPEHLPEIYPSSGSLLSHVSPEPHQLFTGPYTPLPQAPAEQQDMKMDRTQLENLFKSFFEHDLMDWIYHAEARGPIIYLAFGSIVRPDAMLLNRIIEALSFEDWRVLWSLPEDLHIHLPQDLHKEKWCVKKFLPQAQILRSDRVSCFFSHMGANSTTESLVCGVPMVCMPFFMDQFEWTNLVCMHRKAGLEVSKNASTSCIRDAVRQVLTLPTFRAAANDASSVMRAQERAMLQRLGAQLEVPRAVGSGVMVTAALAVSLIKGKQQQESLPMEDRLQRLHSLLSASAEEAGLMQLEICAKLSVVENLPCTKKNSDSNVAGRWVASVNDSWKHLLHA